MAQLDRLLSVMISNRADALVLKEGEAAALMVEGQARPVTKPLSGPQVIALLKEIASPQGAQLLDQKQPIKFRYSSEDSVFVVRAMLQGEQLNVTIVVDDAGEFQRAT